MRSEVGSSAADVMCVGGWLWGRGSRFRPTHVCVLPARGRRARLRLRGGSDADDRVDRGRVRGSAAGRPRRRRVRLLCDEKRGAVGPQRSLLSPDRKRHSRREPRDPIGTRRCVRGVRARSRRKCGRSTHSPTRPRPRLAGRRRSSDDSVVAAARRRGAPLGQATLLSATRSRPCRRRRLRHRHSRRSYDATSFGQGRGTLRVSVPRVKDTSAVFERVRKHTHTHGPNFNKGFVNVCVYARASMSTRPPPRGPPPPPGRAGLRRVLELGIGHSQPRSERRGRSSLASCLE